MEHADHAAGDLQTAPRGLLRVTAPVSFALRHLDPAIAEYLAAYPDVSVELSLDDHYVDLVEERFDLAIRAGRLADSSLTARRLCSATMTLCAAPAYLEANGAPHVPSDLTKHNCLVYTYTTPQSAWRFVNGSGREHVVRVSGRFLANNGDALRALALNGVGIILAPNFIVEEDLQAGNLIQLLPEYTTQETPVHAVYPHGRLLSAKTRTFIDFLAARCNHTAQAKRHAANGKRDGRAEVAGTYAKGDGHGPPGLGAAS